MSIGNVFSIICVINFFILESIFKITDSLETIGIIAFGGFFLLLPLLIIFISMNNVKKTYDSKNWPHVMGKIEKTERRLPVIPFLQSKKFELTFAYSIDDKVYCGEMFSPERRAITASDLLYVIQLRRKKISELAGSVVRVFYNPKNPWESFLCREVYWDFHRVLLPATNALIISMYLFYCIY